ncbi:MAG: hypothetical protein KDD85_04150 [Parvularculaceae bacterium]|nr:hypothetical protein [Parvularculaceae bacterium]
MADFATRPAFIALALFLSSCSAAPQPDAPSRESGAPTPDAIVAAERAFAADGLERGVKASFLAYSADEAIVFAPDPASAHTVFGARPDRDANDSRPPLIWWPLYAGISRSGDLGFTTGPYAVGEERRGHYFTIWRKQADGNWKWILDAGVGADASGEAAQGSDVSYLPTSAEGAASRDAAMAEVSSHESALAVAAREDLSSAYGPFMDDDARLHSEGPPPAIDAPARAAALAARPARLEMAPIGGGASDAGDMVWTYGEARAPGAASTGYYVRLWQYRSNGWRLVFDEYLPPADGAQ